MRGLKTFIGTTTLLMALALVPAAQSQLVGGASHGGGGSHANAGGSHAGGEHR